MIKEISSKEVKNEAEQIKENLSVMKASLNKKEISFEIYKQHLNSLSELSYDALNLSVLIIMLERKKLKMKVDPIILGVTFLVPLFSSLAVMFGKNVLLKILIIDIILISIVAIVQGVIRAKFVKDDDWKIFVLEKSIELKKSHEVQL